MRALEGQLGGPAREALEVHLDTCAACRELYAVLLSAQHAGDGAPTADAVLPPGAAVGRYRVLAFLGAGGMGRVYRAKDPRLDRDVALKHVLAADAGAAHAAGLLREAQALARLAHPNVLPVYDAGADGEHLYLALELVQGQTLAQWLHERPRGTDELLGRFLEAGEGLAAAHAAGLVHGDFKPQNVLLGEDGRARVADFGLARRAGAGGAPGAGTARYLAPEQRAGAPPDARADLYAFCVALRDALDDPARAGQRVPGRVRRALARGLAPDPRARHPSMRALLGALRPRAHRRWAIPAALLAGALLGAALGPARRWSEEARCEAQRTQALALFGAREQAAQRAAFEALGLPHGAGVQRHVARRLAETTAELAARRAQACSTLRGEPLRRREACLAEATAELSELISALAHPDRALVDRAPEVVAAYDAPERCGREDAQAGAAVDRPALRAALGAAQALAAAGRWREAAARADGVLAELEPAAADGGALPAGRVVEPALAARARLLRGGAAAHEGQLGRAEAELSRAAELGDFAHAAAVTAEAWTRLLRLHAGSGGKLEAAEREAHLAEAAVARAGEPPALRIALEQALATQSDQREQLESALQHQERALAVARAAFGEADVRTALALRRVAQSHYLLGRWEGAKAAAVQAQARLGAVLGPAHPELSRVETVLGLTQQRLGELALARQTLAGARARLEALYGADHAALASPWVREGWALAEAGEPAAGEALIRRGLAIVERNGGREQALYAAKLGVLGEVQVMRGQLAEAEESYREVLRLYERGFGVDSPKLALVLSHLGEVRRLRGDLKGAGELLRRALAMMDSPGASVSPLERAQGRLSLAEVLVAQRREPGGARALAEGAREAFARQRSSWREQERAEALLARLPAEVKPAR